MTRPIRSILTLIVLTVAALCAPLQVFAATAETAPTPAPKLIRVGLGRSQVSATVSSEGPFAVMAGAQTLVQAQGGQLVTLSLTGGGVQVDTLPGVHKVPVRIVPAKPAAGATNFVRYKQRKYRGELEVFVNAKDGRLSVVNVVDLEEYLLGVVPNEMSSGWHAEALKAQAVASRTYALYEQQAGQKYKHEGFDVSDDTGSQEYRGVGSEKPNTNMAVAATKGQVITYQGQIISAFYHSSSGGFTEDNENVWGPTAIAYLRGVADPDNHPDNPHYQWTLVRTLEQVAQGMRSELGIDPGALIDLQVGPLSRSGRPVSFTAIGSKGTFQVRPEHMRWAIGASSHIKEIVRAVTTVALKVFGLGGDGETREVATTVSVQSAAGVTTRKLHGAVAVGASGTPVTLQTEKKVAADGTLQFKGGGNGHRIGMSQWGARVLAEQGKTYTEILAYYYKGTKVETR